MSDKSAIKSRRTRTIGAVLHERLDLDAPATQEGVGHQLQRRAVYVDGAAADEAGKVRVQAPIFRALGGIHRTIVHRHRTAAQGQVQPAGIRVDIDVPGLKAGLAKIHVGLCRGAMRVGQQQARGDRRLAVSGVGKLGPFQGERTGNDAGQYRQGIDPRIEYAQASRLPDPRLAGMPDPHVLFPRDRCA